MHARADALLERVVGDRPKLAKLVRYTSASVAGVVTSQVVLLTCLLVLDMDAVPSNVVAVTAGAVPNYLINRAWTFNKRGSHSVMREIVPFWGMAFLGLLLSTVAVSWADTRFDSNPLVLSAANIGSFGVLWVAKFFVLERVLFKVADFIEEHDHGHLHRVDDDGDPAGGPIAARTTGADSAATTASTGTTGTTNSAATTDSTATDSAAAVDVAPVESGVDAGSGSHVVEDRPAS